MRLPWQQAFPLMDKTGTKDTQGMSRNIYGNVASEIAPYVNMFGSQANQSFADQTRQMNESEQGYLANQATLNAMAPYGGMDQQYVDTTNQGFANLANYGGFTPGQQNAYMRAAMDPLATTAANLTGAAQRSAAATGGDAGAAIANIQGELGGQQASAANAALVGLNQQINANKLAGLGGLGGFQNQLAGARQGVAGLQNQVAGGLAGLYGQTSANTNAFQNQILQALGLKYGTQLGAGQLMAGTARSPGLASTIFGDITSVIPGTRGPTY
jgi:hypothetical protein